MGMKIVDFGTKDKSSGCYIDSLEDSFVAVLFFNGKLLTHTESRFETLL